MKRVGWVLVLAAVGIWLHGAAIAGAAVSGATTPESNRAYVFDALGAHADSTAAENTISSWLRADHYRVTMWRDPTEGKDPLNRHGITLDDVVKMAGAGVIVLNGHGSGAKGLPGDTFPATVAGGVALEAARGHYLSRLGEHWDPSWLTIASSATEIALDLTPAGIRHFFRGKHTGLIFSTGCGTQALAHDFYAQAVVGYVGETCSTNRSGAGDMRLFFKRLAGFDGVQHRTSSAALAAGGYSTGAELRELGEPNAGGPSIHGAVPLVLTPAVARTDPPDGATIASGPRELTVHFDAAMDDRERHDLAVATGCSSHITRLHWRTVLTLDITLKIPKSAAECRVRITLHAAKLHADPRDGYAAPLDGNQAPSPADGAAPNDTNYRLTLIVPGTRPHEPKPPKGVPRCPAAPHAHQICVIYDGTVQGSERDDLETGSGEAHVHLVWIFDWPTFKGMYRPVRAFSSASGDASISWNPSAFAPVSGGFIRPPDCHTTLHLLPQSQLGGLLTPNGPGPSILMGVLNPFFRDLVSANCPTSSNYPGGDAKIDAAAETFDTPFTDFGGQPGTPFKFSLSRPATTKKYTGTYSGNFLNGVNVSNWTATITAVVGPGRY
jgi:hypothetical protein